MITYGTATLAELNHVLDWATDEGWNPGLDDAAAYYAADADGFFVARDNDVPVASISVVNHTDAFAFLGLYITVPAYRGKRIGFGLWQHAIQHAGRRTIGLDGVPEQQANYAASGFKSVGGTVRFAGTLEGARTNAVSVAQPSDIEGLVAREAQLSGVRKEAYLSAWFSNTSTRTTLIAEDGFCTVRRCRSGAKVGPLVADSPQAALRLLRHAAAEMGPDLTIDVPQSASDLTAVCQGLGFTAGFETARMYVGAAPPASGTLFAVTSLELG